MIIPAPKRIEEVSPIYIGEKLKVFLLSEGFGNIEFTLGELLTNVNVCIVDNEKDANVILSQVKSEKPEEYSIEFLDGKVNISFSDFLGARNAIATLAQILESGNSKIYIGAASVYDYPDAQFRSFMHDVGRKYVPIDELKMHILLMAKCKMNYLHFHFSEAAGFAIALKDYPELKGASATDGMQYSEEEIIDLVEYAEKLGIEVIPEIDIPGHGVALTEAYPNLACDLIDGKKSWGWALCVGNEETYPIVLGIIKAAAKLFKSKYFHIGTDEISMTDEKRIPHPIADWTRCRRCRQLMQSYDLDGEVKLFYRFLKKIYDALTPLGKKLIIWNDWIDISKSPDIPRDILIEFWRVAADTRGPHVNCSMQRFLDEGFDVINANFPDTYIDLYVSYENLKGWKYNRSSADDSETKGKIIGADVCAWDVHDHYVWSIPVSIPLFAEKMWNSDSKLSDETLKAVSCILFGTESFNIFDYTKDVIILDDKCEIFKDGSDRIGIKNLMVLLHPTNAVEKYCIKAIFSLL